MAATTSVRSSYAGTVDDETPVTAAGINELSGGNIGYGELAEILTVAGTENAIVIPNVPVSAEGRLLSVRTNGVMRATGPSPLQIHLYIDSTLLLDRDLYAPASSVDVPFSAEILVHSPDAGNHDFTLAYGRGGGSSETVNIIADDDTKCLLIVDDIGPDHED